MPWSSELFSRHGQRPFFSFYLSILLLHWSSVGATICVLHHNHLRLADLGLTTSAAAGIQKVAYLFGIGLVFILFRLLVPYTMQRLAWLAFFPTTLSEQAFFCSPHSVR